jgi:hypothetical protein
VHSAEVIGTAGVEKALDARLRDPAQGGKPLDAVDRPDGAGGGREVLGAA